MSKSTKSLAEREFKAEDGCGQDSMGEGLILRSQIAADKQAENVKDVIQFSGPSLSLTGCKYYITCLLIKSKNGYL